MSIIETERLVLRPFIESDAQAACHNSKQPIVAHFMADMVLDTIEDARKWISWLGTKCNTHEPCLVLAIERKTDHAVVGLVGVAPKKEISGEIEILFSISDEYQNQGYATEAAKAIIWWAFEQAGQDMLSAIVKPENKASLRVIEKLGFVYGDTRVLPYDGKDCEFGYFRLYHTDYLSGPEWDVHTLYRPEPMATFFDTRADGYNRHMLSEAGSSADDYKKLGSHFPKTSEAIQVLDIGCGTGIELDYIWAHAPHAHIICVDVSRGMLDILLQNHPGSHDRIAIVEASYIDWPYPENAFDIVVSNMTMHHLWPEQKVAIYRKILGALKTGGSYIEGDFIVDAIAAEQYKRRYETITANLPDKAKAGEYHIDIPFTLDVQKKLLCQAGFGVVDVLDSTINSGNGAILKARK
jgi:RimJ/RimL family protein N-acetyltransferase/phospholipid N-methyltransferase